MEVDVCVALISRRTQEEDSRGVTKLQGLDSLVDQGRDVNNAGEPETADRETINPHLVELNARGYPGEVERNAVTSGSLPERGVGWKATVPNFGVDLAQSVSELLQETCPSSQFSEVPITSDLVTQGNEGTMMSGIYRPAIEFEPVNVRNLGSNNAVGVIKDDCDENRTICFSQNNSDTFNDVLDMQEDDKSCLMDCNWGKEHNRNCGCVNSDCSPVKHFQKLSCAVGELTMNDAAEAPEENHKEASCGVDCNSVSLEFKNLCKGETNTEMGCVNEEEPTQSESAGSRDLDANCGTDVGPEPECVSHFKLEELPLSAEKTCNKVENTCNPNGGAGVTFDPGTNAETTCSPDKNAETTCAENACSVDRSSQFVLALTEKNSAVESLSPTVNLDFGAVYWTKDKPKSDKDEEAAGNVVVPAGRRGLHVTFANEESLVSGCMEPAIPWIEAWLCSTSELVIAYRAACESIGVKPLKKLLVQLEGVKRFDVRSDLLSLKGESLDWKHCETLEAIFKRVQFHTINMEEMRLEDDVAVTIFDLLQYYQSCLRLIMNRSTNLGTRGWQAWTRLMKQSTGLEHLEARGLSIPDHTLPVIGKYLRTGSMLRTLQLENSIRSGRHLNLLAAAMKTSQSVQELYLGDNQLMPSDGLQLGTMLKGNTTLHLLDVRNNLLQDTGMGHICDGVAEQLDCNGLNTLVMWNNQITYQSMPALSKALAATKSLETLNIGHNNITNEGIHRLKDGLMQNKSLLRIGLQATKISCEGAVALAEFVAESLKLVRLDLRENSIKTGGLMALSLSLKVNQTVTCVDLDKEPKKESGMKDFAEQQKRLLFDIASYATRNSLLSNANENLGDKGHDLESPTTDMTSVPKNDADAEGSEALALTRAACLCLSLAVPTRCETLESPSFSPEFPSLISSSPAESNDAEASTGSASPPIINQKPPVACVGTDASATVASLSLVPPANVVSASSENKTPADAPISATAVSKVQSQSNSSTSAEGSKSIATAPAVQKPAVPEKPVAPPDKKLVRTKRKFTISKAVLPSALSPKLVASTAVLFTARPTSSSDEGHLDSDTHVCIVGTSLSEDSSSAADLSRKRANELDLHPLVKKFSTSLTTDKAKADDVLPNLDSNVLADATLDEVRLIASCAGPSADENKETVVVETSQSVAAETGASSDQTDGSLPENSDVPFALESFTSVSSSLVPELTLTPASVSVAKEGRPDVNIFETDQSYTDVTVQDFSTKVVGNGNRLLMSSDIVGVEKSVKNVCPAERDQSIINVHAVERDHSLNCLVSVGRDCSSTCTDVCLESGHSLAIVSKQLEHSSVSLHLSVAFATENESVVSVENESLECRESSSSSLSVTAKGFSDETCCTQSHDSAGNECRCSDTPSSASGGSQESISGLNSASINLERWSMQMEDESANFLVHVAHFDSGLSSENAFKTVGNNGQDCFNLSVGLEDFKKRNSFSSSEGTDMIISDLEDFRTAEEESESENSFTESAEWKSGSAEKSSEYDCSVASSDSAKVDDNLVLEEGDRLLEVVSTAVSTLVSEAKLSYSVNNLKHDVLDSVNANTSTSGP